MKYEPKPIDTSQVSLSPDLQDLEEVLARNTHELWARKRMADGLVYGPMRQGQHHPSLVPYDELPDREKEYDRQTAMEAIKVMIAMGYRIEKP